MVSNILPEEITSSLKRGQSQKPDKISKFYFVKLLSCERAAGDVYIDGHTFRLCAQDHLTRLRHSRGLKRVNVPSNVSSIVVGIEL